MTAPTDEESQRQLAGMVLASCGSTDRRTWQCGSRFDVPLQVQNLLVPTNYAMNNWTPRAEMGAPCLERVA